MEFEEKKRKEKKKAYSGTKGHGSHFLIVKDPAPSGRQTDGRTDRLPVLGEEPEAGNNSGSV